MSRLMTAIERVPPFVCHAGSFLFILLLSAVYYLTASQLSFSIFFLIPIAYATWTLGYRAGVCYSLLSVFVWYLADNFDGNLQGGNIWLAVNMVLRLSLFIAVAWVLSALKRMVEDHKKAARIL